MPVFLNANLRLGAEALRIPCRFSWRDFTVCRADRSHQRRSRPLKRIYIVRYRRIDALVVRGEVGGGVLELIGQLGDAG